MTRLRPRYGRIAAFTASLTVTATAVLAGAGALPTVSSAAAESPREPSAPEEAISLVAEEPEPDQTPALPEDSGRGRRVVFDMSDQRVWLVGRNGSVRHTYPVSGSRYDNLDAATYRVYSRSKEAVGIDGSSMRFMVRFAHGANAAIGFHDIPVLDGERVQTKAELGTPLSHGCIRQARPDARRLWKFAPVGTTVVVTE